MKLAALPDLIYQLERRLSTGSMLNDKMKEVRRDLGN